MSSIVFFRTADFISPRIRKLTDISVNIFDEVYFFGAKRSDSPVKPENAKVIFKQIGIFYPYSSMKYILGTIIYFFAAFFKLIKVKPKVIHGSDLEGALPAVFYKFFFRKTYVVVNVHDNFFARYKVSPTVRKFIKWFEFKVYSKADICFFPDYNRVKIFEPYKVKNYMLIPNTPSDPGYVDPPVPTLKIKLFVAGFVSSTRGLDMLLEVASRNSNIELHIAGRANDPDLEKIKKVSNAIFYGRLHQKEVLKLGQSCHIVPIFYAPDVQIHVFASPNKLFDAFALGRPIIINDGLNVTEDVKSNNAGEVIKYNDVEAFEVAIEKITANYDDYKKKCQYIRKKYEDNFDWKIYESKLEVFFKDLV